MPFGERAFWGEETEGVRQAAKTEEFKQARQRVTRMVHEFAEQRGLGLQPDIAQLRYVMDGLAENMVRHGKAYCPCRELTGNTEADRALICPCSSLQDDLAARGECECGLYVRAPEETQH
mgnify:CR=1 FL=1